ncbi:hypothetical protein RclHR1_11910001 [Rhizophagus clarus]|uniref:Uncharacterized protein n=1 Tax=Rhizophagus clarus TaxID=94130 RepID=A0A2Z6Q730_9GLOM|nr:hypothetical protein RclHR1_11910001 [Rhizophagus clarus]GES90009.1 hypothetical protein GLOIN_2v1769887 [Rhizophagus clarus]
MQNNINNVDDDYAFAKRLQEQFNEEYIEGFRQATNFKEETNVSNDSNAYGIDNYANNDYNTAMRLQQMYDKQKGTFENDYEDIVPRMSNMTFGHRDHEEETYSSTKSRKEQDFFSTDNYFDNSDTPPPYTSPQKPVHTANDPWLTYNNNSSSSQGSQQQMPLNQQQQTSPDQTNLQAMLTQVLEALQNQQNNNQPTRNNNYHQSDLFMRNNNYEKPDYYNYNQPDHLMRNKLNYNDYDQSDHFMRNNGKFDYNNNNPFDQFRRNNNYDQSDHFGRNNNYDQSDYFGRNNNYNQTDHLRRNNSNTYGTTRNRINLSGQGVFKILLLGGTGTGKSTIINTMASYFLNGTLDKPKIVIPTKFHEVTEREFASKHSEAKFDDVTKSQTTKCYNYTFNHPDNPAHEFIFIDTPGLSDTNGVKQDDKNIQEIIDTAISAGSLSAIVIIANGTEARVTPSIKNTLVRLANNLPDELIDRNLLLILTKCSKSSASFSEEAFTKEIARPKKIFYMDNQAFCTNPQIWKNDEDERPNVQYNWDKSLKTIDNLLMTITEMSSTSTQAFQNMKNYRDRIKSEITKVTQDIANIQKVQDSLDAAQKALQKTGDQKKSFANYTKTESIKLKKIVNASYHSTVCTLHLKDNIICHDHCGLEFKNTSGTNHFSGCYCMGSNGLCKECGCGPLSHFHDKVKLVEQTQTINKILEDIKLQYDNANQQQQKYSNDVNGYHSSLATLQAAANAKYGLIHKLCNDLSKICSRFNFVDELHANIESMKQDSKMIKNNNLRKNAEMEIRKLEKLANDLSSKRGGNYY